MGDKNGVTEVRNRYARTMESTKIMRKAKRLTARKSVVTAYMAAMRVMRTILERAVDRFVLRKIERVSRG